MWGIVEFPLDLHTLPLLLAIVVLRANFFPIGHCGTNGPVKHLRELVNHCFVVRHARIALTLRGRVLCTV